MKHSRKVIEKEKLNFKSKYYKIFLNNIHKYPKMLVNTSVLGYNIIKNRYSTIDLKGGIRMRKLKFLSFIILFIIVFSSISFAENNKDFKDIKSSDWFYSSVNNLSSKGIISGYSDDTFRPNNSVTTAEFLKLSMETAEIEIDYNTTPWNKGIMDKALSLNIITKDLYNKPNEPIKRKDVALVLSKLIEKTDLKDEFIRGKDLDYDRFKYLLYDTTKLSQEYRTAIYKLFEYQLIVGSTNEKDQVFYNPESNLTRAEIAAIVERLIEPSKRLNKYAEFPKRKDYFSKYDDGDIAHSYELNKYFSADWATPDIKNKRFIYSNEELGKRTENYILSESLIPNLNKILYDLSRVLIKEGGDDYISNELWGLQTAKGIEYNPRIYIQKSTDMRSTLTGGNTWSYMFWEKKPMTGYDKTGYNNFLWINIGSLSNGYWKYAPKSLYKEYPNGVVDYEYVNMFRASLIAIFGEKDGHEIFEYIFNEYMSLIKNPNFKYDQNNPKFKYKDIGKYKIVYEYGENANKNFYFSFK